MYKFLLFSSLFLVLVACKNNSSDGLHQANKQSEAPFYWDNATMYFLLTDRFNNGDKSNDINFDRNKDAATLRGFEGGDFAGITQKINEGYFTNLGVDALWFSPVFEQIEDGVDEGTGFTYPYHGYWIKDWSAVEPNFGTQAELKNLVEAAHAKGIRVVFDVVLNHTGPVTEKDPLWENWARTSPACTYKNYETTTACTLVANLPDIYTESEEEVTVPPHILAKWEAEGRKEQEMAELDAFFAETGLPKTAENHIIKWLLDLITDYGVDGFRVDTVKHTEEDVWKKLGSFAQQYFVKWKKNHPEKVLDDAPFYMVGEVYGYSLGAGRAYDFNDKKVDYFSNGFDQLINFQFKYDAQKSYEDLFTYNRGQIDHALEGKNVLNYLSSHDDGAPYDALRVKPYETANRLLLSPGAAQIYYGDETARVLKVDGAEGDANLRGFMNWSSMKEEVLLHWQKLGQFRRKHPAIGMGAHKQIEESPYTFSRVWKTDKVVIALDVPVKEKVSVSVGDVFENGTELHDSYSGQSVKVKGGIVSITTPYSVVLLERGK